MLATEEADQQFPEFAAFTSIWTVITAIRPVTSAQQRRPNEASPRAGNAS